MYIDCTLRAAEAYELFKNCVAENPEVSKLELLGYFAETCPDCSNTVTMQVAFQEVASACVLKHSITR